MSDTRSTDVMLAFGVGLVAGVAAALLLAPASGEETRRRVRTFARGIADEVMKEGGRAADFVRDHAGRFGDEATHRSDGTNA